MNYNFTFGRRARLIENMINNYEIINLDNYVADKPIVLVLGGNGTTDDRASNGNAKIVYSMLGVFNENVDIISVNYNQALGEPNITKNCNDIVNKLFVPLVSCRGNRIDINTACKNIRNITIFGHCRGVDGVFRRIMLSLRLILSNLGYNQFECGQILQQIVLVSYGANINDVIDDVKAIYCLAFGDDMYPSNTKSLATKLITNLDNIDMSIYDKQFLDKIKISKSSALTYKQLIQFLTLYRRIFTLYESKNIRLFAYNLYKDSNDHSFRELARNNDWNKNENALITGDYVSRCLACALCNSVANSILNQKYDYLIDFDLDKLNSQLQDICRQHNYIQSKFDGEDLEMYNTEIYK